MVKENEPTAKQVPKTNVTELGLYLTPREAYEMWKADPERVNILDVRSFEEYIFVGHAEMARNIPLVFPRYELSADSGERPTKCSVEPNPDFVSAVKGLFAPTDTILVMCVSGHRAAIAVNQLAKAGFENVYNIINGLEGEKVDDPVSVYHGKPMKNGWKNCGLPWTYDFLPELMWVSPQK